jgi:leucyl aminopeptidase (aminopeptidase T)
MFRECLQLKRGERVAVLDDGAQPALAAAMMSAAKELGGRPQLVKVRAGRAHSSPVPEARKALLASDVVAAPTGASVSHSIEVTQARERGARVASLPGVTEQHFLHSMGGDFAAIRALVQGLRRHLEKAKSVWIRTPAGTNVKLNVQGRAWFPEDGDLSRPGSLGNIPFGEVPCAPRETVGQGEIAFDWWGQEIKPSHHARVYLRNGRISEWNPAAAPFVRELQATGTCGFIIAEVSFGANPYHKNPVGNILYDEKIAGTVHLAFGMNTSLGGKNACGAHEDVVLLKPTVLVDDRPLLERGVFVPADLKGGPARPSRSR